MPVQIPDDLFDNLLDAKLPASLRSKLVEIRNLKRGKEEERLRKQRERVARFRAKDRNDDVTLQKRYSNVMKNIDIVDYDSKIMELKKDHDLMEDHSLPIVVGRARDIHKDEFERFWKVYPRKTGKQDALKVFHKAIHKVTVDHMIVAAERYAASQPDKQFIMEAARWLRGERWNDETAPRDQAPVLPFAKPLTPFQQEQALRKQRLEKMLNIGDYPHDQPESSSALGTSVGASVPARSNSA